MALTGDKILKHAGIYETREVNVPAWKDENGDDVVLVRGMTIREYEVNNSRAEAGLGTASVLARCVLNPDGSRAFTDEQVGAIAELPLHEVKLLDDAIGELSGLIYRGPNTEQAVAEAVASAEGNSGATTSDDSASD